MSYDAEFYRRRTEATRVSAAAVLELIWPEVGGDSVVDIGCATGIWLAACTELGARRVLGVDGPWVDAAALEIPVASFLQHDLASGLPDGLDDLDGRFDLALCIEVAEHLSAARGDELIAFLCRRSDCVLFSAAVPGQGGTGHVNEQRQSYWQQRFASQGYRAFDLMRPRLWRREDVNVIYRQNLLCYAREASAAFGRLVAAGHEPLPDDEFALDRVHPELFERREDQHRRLGFVGHVRLAVSSLLGRR
ncbi:MAG: class I SAM-dependent methyltransferase [Pseudomonadota bacterium]